MRNSLTCQECIQCLGRTSELVPDPETLRLIEEHIASCPPCGHFLKTKNSSPFIGALLRDRKTKVPSGMVGRLKSFLEIKLREQPKQ